MEAVLDSVRRIVNKWVNTSTPLTANASAGDTTLTVRNTNRFREGDTVIVRNSSVYELSDLIVDEIIDTTHLKLESGILNDWTVANSAIV